jgi:pimeloyl-ACP methyl ester carboxylesterase
VRVLVDGVRIWFDIEGPGLVADGAAMEERPCLILIHGAPGASDHTSFKPTFSALADVAQLVYIDLRGCGRSEGEPETITLERLADDVAALIDALGIRKPVVLGQSAGGFVAMALAIRHPGIAGRLILSSTQSRVDIEKIVATSRRLGGESAAEAAMDLARDDPSIPNWIRVGMPLYNKTPQDPGAAARTTVRWSTWERFFDLWYRRQNTLDIHAGLGEVHWPTLVMTGTDDPICPTEDSDDIVDAMPPGVATLVRFQDCGHGTWRDAPAEAIDAIRTFVCS